MSMTEAERHELFELAKREVGVRFAELMIKAMPPEPERLATKDDLAVLGGNLRAEMAALRTDLKTEMADLRTEMADLRTELKTEMVELRLSVAGEIHDAFRAQTRALVFTLAVSVLLIALSNTLAVVAR